MSLPTSVCIWCVLRLFDLSAWRCWADFSASSPASLAGGGQMPEIVANAYPAKSTVRTYVWRFVYACQCWVLFLLALIAPLVV
jgi:hypothetical protein